MGSATREAVFSALAECDELGEAAFLPPFGDPPRQLTLLEGAAT